MTDPNYRKAREALDEADALIAQTEEMLAEAEFEAALAEGEQLLSEIDRAIDMLNRLCDSDDFSEKIAAEFPTLAEKSTEELAQLQKRQSAVAGKLQDRLLKEQELFVEACEALYGDGENVSEEAAELKKKLATLKKKLSATQQKYHHAKKIANAAKIILCDRALSQAMEQAQDSDRASKLKAEIALLDKEVAIHSAKSDEYETEADKIGFESEESQKWWDLSFAESDKVLEKLERSSELLDELSALSCNNVEEK